MSDPASISNSELEVLKVLWASDTASVRSIHDRLQADGWEWAYNTVQTLLNRLTAKGFVSAARDGRVVEYSVVATRDDLVRQQLDGIAEKICDGSPVPLVQSLMEGRKYSKAELRDLRSLLDELEAGSSKKKRKS